MPVSPLTTRSLLARKESKVVFVSIVLLVIWVLSGSLGGDDDAATQSQDSTLYVPEVQVKASVAEAFVRELTLSAVTESPRAVEVSTQTSGIIESVLLKEGSVIYAGDTIAVLRQDARQERLEQAEAELKQRKLEYNAAKKLAKSGLRAETALAESYFQMKQAETHLKEAQLDANYINVQSPFTGILNEVFLHEGDVVKSLETPVAEILEVHPMLVVGYVPEKWRRQIRQGSSASVSLGDDQLIYGVVDYVSQKAEESTRTFRVEVAIDNKSVQIPAGITAEIYIPLGNIKAHYIPASALSLSDEGRIQVKYVDDGNNVLANHVEIAGEDEGGLWVTGLPDQINMITFGQAFVQVGDTVNTSTTR